LTDFYLVQIGWLTEILSSIYRKKLFKYFRMLSAFQKQLQPG